MNMKKKLPETNCESCSYYHMDEDMGMYICEMNLDEDEMRYFLQGQYAHCPYYHYYDEYEIVRKQN